MTKTALWGIVGAVVVVGGIVMFAGGSDDAMTETDGQGEATGGSSMVSGAFTGTGSIKCDYTQEGGFVGTAYVKGGKVRIEGTVNGAPGNIIYGGEKVYTWGTSDGQEYGFVMDMPSGDTEVSTGVPSRAALEGQFNNGSTHCENYRASDSLFTPPPSVRFQSMADLMQMPAAGAGGY
jgi:hypothetical protein